MEDEFVCIVLYLISFLLITANRYSLIAIGILSGTVISLYMFNNVALFHFTEFVLVSVAIFLGGGFAHAIEKATEKV